MVRAGQDPCAVPRGSGLQGEVPAPRPAPMEGCAMPRLSRALLRGWRAWRGPVALSWQQPGVEAPRPCTPLSGAWPLLLASTSPRVTRGRCRAAVQLGLRAGEDASLKRGRSRTPQQCERPEPRSAA